VESNPLITIIVAVFNGAKTLERCISSFIHQTYPYKELIIMDGGSADGSVELLQRYDSNIKYWESKPDKGVYHAWNKALEHAEGEWICFIGSDDFFISNDVLSNVAPKLKDAKFNGTKYAFGKVAYFSHKNNKILEYENDSKSLKRLRKGRPLFHSGSFHYKTLFEKNNKFNESYKIAADFELILRELKDNEAFYFEDIVICMGVGGLSYDLSYREKMIKEGFVAWQSNKMPTLPWYLYLSYLKVKIFKIVQLFLGEKLSLQVADSLRKIFGKKSRWSL
jgi:glycosyltransferase involved in cell wall biosynthesis